jgi:hypothetical protein
MSPVLGATTGQAAASPSAPPRASAPVTSSYENASRSVVRDDGLSVPLPNGRDLWVFGDTSIYNSNASGQMALSALIPGGTAAEGPYSMESIPSSLMEVPTPGQSLSMSASNAPTLYMPAPTNVYLPDGSGGRCSSAPGRYPARWPSGAATIPNTSEVLVTYAEVCVTGSFQFDVEGWGFMEYNWQTNGLDVPPDDVFPPVRSGAALAPDRAMGSPVISNGRVALFSSNCTELYVSCLSGQIYFTTLPDTVSALSDPASYNVAAAATDRSTVWQPVGIAVSSYPDAPLRMIETTAITGTYDVLTATAPGGPWHSETSGTVPGCQGLRSGFCYSLVGHPELSTHSQLVITYYDPGAGPMGTSGPVGHLVGTGASYGAPQPGGLLAAVPQLGSPNPHTGGPPPSSDRPPAAQQAVSSPPCCPPGKPGAVDADTSGRIQGGPPPGPVGQELNYSYPGEPPPPHLAASVRLVSERSGSNDGALKLMIAGLSVFLIIASLRRGWSVNTSKKAGLDSE